MSAEQYPEIQSKIEYKATYALIYAPGPQWIVGRSITEQNLGTHLAYIGNLYAEGRVLYAGPFLDHEGGGLALVRGNGREEADAMLAGDPAIKDGVLTGAVRRWHAVFDEAEDLRATLSEAQTNRRAVEALFAAVDRRDRAGVLAGYAEEITIHEAASLPYGGDYAGPDVTRHGAGFLAAWNRFQPDERRGLDPHIIAEGDHVVVVWRHKLENSETGDSLDLPAVSVYRMQHAKITDSRMYHFDTAALLRFLERNSERPASQVPEGAR